MEEILQFLEAPVRRWISSLTPKKHAELLNALYSIPDIMTALAKKSVKGSAEIGKSGEDLFEKICHSLPINYSLTNTAKQGHKGDFVLLFEYRGGSYRCLVDIKKYSTTVPKKELDKFHDDLLTDKYDCGMILSLTSRLVGYPEAITLSNYHGISTMYLSDLSDEKLIIQSIQMLFMSLVSKLSVYGDSNVHNKSKKDESETDYTTKLATIKQTIANAVSLINTAVGYSNSTRQTLRDLEKSVHSHVQKCNENLLTLGVQIDHALKMLMHEDANKDSEIKDDTASKDTGFSTKSVKAVDKSQTDKPNKNIIIKRSAVKKHTPTTEVLPLVTPITSIADTPYNKLKSLPWKSISIYKTHRIFESAYVSVLVNHHNTDVMIVNSKNVKVRSILKRDVRDVIYGRDEEMPAYVIDLADLGVSIIENILTNTTDKLQQSNDSKSPFVILREFPWKLSETYDSCYEFKMAETTVIIYHNNTGVMLVNTNNVKIKESLISCNFHVIYNSDLIEFYQMELDLHDVEFLLYLINKYDCPI
jgi:hypothetical protein